MGDFIRWLLVPTDFYIEFDSFHIHIYDKEESIRVVRW